MYINENKNAVGNHGNPHSNPTNDSVVLPEELIAEYIACKGFCDFVVVDGVVSSIRADNDALAAYNATLTEETASEKRKRAYTTGECDGTDWHIVRNGETLTCDQLTQLGLQYEFRGETETADEIRATVSAKIAEIRATYAEED